MARLYPHEHACQSCGAKTLCHGELERNHDGAPETVCRDFHMEGGYVDPNFLCGRCQIAACAPDDVQPAHPPTR